MVKYCKNCAYFKRDLDPDMISDDNSICKATENVSEDIGDPYGYGEGIQAYHPKILNANNNCKYYKVKWWKIWI